MEPEVYYKNEISLLISCRQRMTGKSNILVACKVIFFCCIIASICYIAWSGVIFAGILLSIISVKLYIGVLSVDAIIYKKVKCLQSQIQVLENEVAFFHNDYSPFDDGAEFIDPHHQYSYDLDVFGISSLFNRINRTITYKGKITLAQKLTNLPADMDIIHERQEAIKELAGLSQWRIKFIANEHVGDELDRLSEMIAKGKRNALPLKGIIPHMIVGLTIMSLLAWIAGLVSPIVFCSLIMVQYILSFSSARHTNWAMRVTNNLYKECGRYICILRDIEAAEFKSDLLNRHKQKLFDESTGSIKAFARLSKILNLYEQRGNALMYIVLNGLVMYDIFVSRMFFKWIERYAEHMPGWTDAIAEIDALVSLGTYAFNHPANHYAEILADSSDTIIEAVDVVHPFLVNGVGVANSFVLKRNDIAIVTGANMAGKSTFLRTIGVSFVLAANGVPVCASKFSFVPVSLFSSMRTTDNLSKDTSYFQAELSRLNQMFEYVESRDFTLIILDEILKGTNSQDKLNGSMLVLEELSKHPVSGIVATHDLGITRLEEKHPGMFRNYCFEIELSDEMRYSYKIGRGVARNMNASHLIEIMLGKI